MSAPEGFRLTESDLAPLSVGAALLGTGGGGNPYLGMLRTREILRSGAEVRILPLDALEGDLWVGRVGSIGAPLIGIERFAEGGECLRALRAIEARSGRRISALIAAEIGGANAMVPMITAAQAGLPVLDGDGITFVGPNDGEMACGEFGPGRMAEPAEIVGAISSLLQPKDQPLAGRKVVITAGPTREPIDPVRFISNHSSGKQGYAIAAAAVALGAETVIVSGPVSLPIPPGAQVLRVETARDMLVACEDEMPCDIAIFAAAVADWRVDQIADQKMKKRRTGPPVLSLTENPDILKTIAGKTSKRPTIVVGFAAETEQVVANAQAKLKKKGCDLIVANDVAEGTGVFGGDRNTVHLVSRAGVESWPAMSKQDVSTKLMHRLVLMLRADDRKS